MKRGLVGGGEQGGVSNVSSEHAATIKSGTTLWLATITSRLPTLALLWTVVGVITSYGLCYVGGRTSLLEKLNVSVTRDELESTGFRTGPLEADT